MIWTDASTINLNQKDGRRKVWKRVGTAHDPKHIVCQYDGGSIMAWACMAANGTGSIMFIDDLTADRSSKRNSVVV